MTESLSVSAKLELSSNVPQVVDRMIAAFDTLNSKLKTTQDALSRLGRKGGSLSKLGDSLDRLSKMRLGSGLADDMSAVADRAKAITSQVDAMAAASERASRAWRTMANTRAPAGGGASNSSRGIGNSGSMLVDTAMVGSIVGDSGTNLIGAGWAANAAVQQQVILAEADKRVTPAIVAKVQAAVAQLQKQYPSLTQVEGLKLFREGMGVFGSSDEALATLPGTVRLQQLYQLTGQGQGGTGGDETQAALKAGDALQSFINPKTGQIDADLFNRFMDFQSRSMLAGGGLVDAKSWLTYARTARASGIGYNRDALEYTQALLELSPGRTGTALQSAFQLFGASTANLSDKNKAAWQQAGLIGKNGQLADASGFQSDPYTWVWNTLLPKLAKQGITSRQQILAWLSAHGQRSTVAGVLSDIAIGETNIQKTKARFDAQDPNAVNALQNSDSGKLQALAAAESNFLVALGKFEEGPGVKILTDLTNALNSITNWATAHPGTAKILVEIGGGVAILADAASKLAMTIYFGAPLVRGLASLASKATDLAKAGVGLAGAAKGLDGLAAAAAPFASGGPVGLALAGLVGFLVEFPKAVTAFNNYLGIDPATVGHHIAPRSAAASLAPAPAPSGDVPHGGYGRTVHEWIKAGAPVTVANPRDIATGAVTYLKRQLGAPNAGPSGVNLRAAAPGSAALATLGSGM